jgi:hypothetical protein
VSARDLADDEWVSNDEVAFEQISDRRQTRSQVFDPHRGVEQNH